MSDRLIEQVQIPAMTGRGVLVQRDQRLKVVAPEGTQVGDLFAFVQNDLADTLSPSQTRSILDKFNLVVGRPLYSVARRPLFMLEEDTVGVHDLLAPACDRLRYLEDFGIEGHRNCRDNLNAALEELGCSPPGYPDPINLFQNTPIADLQGRRETGESLAKPGDYVLLRALEDLVVVVAACSQDQTVLNGGRTKGLLLEVYG